MTQPSENLKPIAVVGISAEFPSGLHSDVNFDHKSFFDFLLAGEEASERIPKDRFNIDGWHGSHPGQVLPDKACFLKDITMFDHFEFGISAKDAASMAVGTRKLVEHSFLALLDSGINSRSRNVGAYMSGVAFDIMSAADADEFDVCDGFGGGSAALANRVSYHLDLLGPSLPVDTACSSSLMALHLGVQGLRVGDCESALVGGSQINHRFLDWVLYSQGSILSPNGKSKPFEATADGFGRGEAVVVIVIKLLEDAIRDGDKIYATVLNTAINSTGSAGPIKAPIAESQAAAMLHAYKGTGREPTEVDFVECHSTGTPVGDPVEVNWVGAYFKRDTELLVGSVKANIGHTEINSFLASFSKVCSIFTTGLIPPQVHCTTLNPDIHWDEYNIRPPSKVEKLTARGHSGKSLISINGSGLGGANGHCVVESPPQKAVPNQIVYSGMPFLLVAAGLSPRSATTVAADLVKLASEIPDELPILSTIYGRRARQMTWRAAAISTSDCPFVFPAPRFVPRTTSPLVFVFSGQGPQHIEMGRQLFKIYPAFRDSILRMDKVHVELTGSSIVQDIGFFGDVKPKEMLPDVWPVTIIVPSIAMVQMALVDLLAALGIRPDLVFAHSAGEAAMLYASGATPQELAMEIAVRRSQAMTSIEGLGGMAAVSCTPVVAREIIQTVLQDAGPDGVLELGCFNAPEAVTISGTHAMLDKAISIAQKCGLFARKVKTRVPGHSSLLEPCRVRYLDEMETAFSRYPGAHVPIVPTYSTQTGLRWESEFTPEYMWSNGRVPVKFEQTVAAVLEEMPEAIFVEISPHPALASYISGMGAKPDKVICPMRRIKNPEVFNEVIDLLQAVGSLSGLGLNTINFHVINATDSLEICKPLPAYPLAPKPLPLYAENSRIAAKQKRSRKGPLSHDYMAINAHTHPDLAQHVVEGEPILPATAFFEMIFEEGARTIWDIELRNMLPLLAEKVLQVEVNLDGHAWSVTSSSGGRNPRLHAIGFMTTEVTDNDLGPIDLAAILARSERTDKTNFYGVLNAHVAFGPLFRRVEACFESDNEALFQIRGNAPELTDHHKYILHPAVLDACIHSMLHPVFTGNADKNVYFLPSHIGRVTLYDLAVEKGIPDTLYCHIVPHSWSPESFSFDAFVVNEQGERLVTLMDFIVSKHWSTPIPTLPDTNFDCIYQPLGLPVAAPTETHSDQQDYAFLDALVPLTDEKVSRSANGSAIMMAKSFAARDVDHENFKDIVQSISSRRANATELKPALILELFPASLDACVTEVRQVLDHALKSGKQMIRILEIGDASASLCTLLNTLFSKYPSLRVDYTASGHEQITSPDVRIVAFDVDTVLQQHSLPAFTYDIVIEVHLLGFVADLQGLLESLNELLVPGGFLIALEANGTHQSTGGKWIDYVFSPQGSWPGLRSGKQYRRFPQSAWDKQLRRAGFKSLNVEQNRETALFLTLRAQKFSLPVLSATSTDAKQLDIFSFKLAHVVDLQKMLLATTSSGGRRSVVWIETTMGSFDGGAATGFTRSLRRELVSVDINLVLFDPVWKAESKVAIIQQLSNFPYLESEIVVDSSGIVLVPRLFSFPPRAPTTLDPSRYWVMEQSGTVTQPALPMPGPRQVMIKISSVSNAESGLQGVVGMISHAGSSKWTVGTRVVTIAQSVLSNFVVVQDDQVAELPKDCNDGASANLALPLFFMALALRLDLRPLESLREIQVIILQTGEIANEIARMLQHIGLAPLLVSPSLPLALPRLSPGDIIMCGLPDVSARAIPSVAGVLLFNWQDTTHGALCTMTQNPWFVGTTFKAHLASFLRKVTVSIGSLTPEQQLPSDFEVSSSITFNRDKSYLIVGGIGSLGLQIAIWMYRKGARHIVLTSRRGVSRLAGTKNRALRHAVDYLKRLPDLNLRLVACDAASAESFTRLLSTLDMPLAGCILSAVLLSDKLFLKQDPESFAVPFKGKTEAFWAIEKTIPIHQLDFFIAITSVSGFGMAGQTNYSSSNTALEYLMARYPNAWSFIAPGISDSTVGISFASEQSSLEMWKSSAMSSYEICLCLEDGLLRMAYSRVSLYVPNLDWDALHNPVSASTIYNHLGKFDASEDKVEVEDPAQLLQDIVSAFIDVSVDDLEHNVPLMSYGLDSLSAARLSTALKPYVTVTQMQLLGDLSLDDLILRMRDTKRIVEVPAACTIERPFAWDALHQPGQTILKLVIGSGTPLIIVHGGAGDVATFRAIQEQFTTPLWAIQTTPNTPMDSIDTLAQFYFEKIKEARPAGPYRIAGFSASSMITLRIVQLLEANEDEIVQLTFVDHFPMLFSSPLHHFAKLPNTFDEITKYAAVTTVGMISDSCSRDATPARRHYGVNLMAASKGLPASTTATESWGMIQKVASMNMKQVVDFAGGWSVWALLDNKDREVTVRRRMIDEVNKIRASVTVHITNKGLLVLLPSDWHDFGVSCCGADSRIIRYDSGHFDIFQRADFSHSIELDWAVPKEHQLASMIHNPAKDDLFVMFQILDSMSLGYMADTLKQNLRVDSEISRQRLFDVTEEFVRTRSQIAWTDAEYQRSRSLFPLYFETTERIGKVHHSIFQSPAGAVAALYSDDMLEGFYRQNKVFTSINQEAAKTFKSLVSSPDFGKRPLRVLEVGSGVGGLTTFLVEVLCDLPNVNIEYTVTDLSYSLASRLAQSFSYKNIVAKMYDLSKSPSEQGLQLGHYDIITGLNVLHAVPDLNATLSNLNSLLRPRGCILQIDSDGAAYTSNPPRPGMIWADFIWGSFQGWFGYTDDRVHCTVDETAWRKRLTETGFSDIEICLEDAGMCILFKARKA